ncbi:MAG: hypothetical protein ACKVI5_06875, partial [Nitrospinaceae bacterium]
DEMIREIEGAQPKFVVMKQPAGTWMSARPDFSPVLKNWAKGYLNREYEIDGVVDILSHKKTLYRWGDQAQEYKPRSMHHLILYKRRTCPPLRKLA